MNSSRVQRAIRDGNQGFTLIEMLTAMAVLTVLLIMIIQVINQTTKATVNESKRMDVVADARQGFDHLAVDWAARARGRGVKATFTKQSGNDAFIFFSQMPSYSGTRTLATIGYQIAKTSGTYGLERASLGYNWRSSDPTPDGNPVMLFPAAPAALKPTDYQVLSPTVFRMEICFISKTTGNIIATPTTTEVEKIGGIIVAVAALDPKSRKIISDGQLDKLIEALPDVTVDGQEPKSLWQAELDQSTFAPDVPRAVVGAIRIFQRTYFFE